jgi:hypothetical protein
MRNEQALRAQEEQERLDEEKRSKMTKSLLLTGDNRGSLGIQFEFSHHGSLKLKSAKSESVKDATAMIDFENTASSRQQKSAATDKLPALGGTSRAPSTGMSGSPSRSFSAGAMGTGAFNASENLTARLEARQQGHKTRKRLKVTFFDCKEMYLFHFWTWLDNCCSQGLSLQKSKEPEQPAFSVTDILDNPNFRKSFQISNDLLHDLNQSVSVWFSCSVLDYSEQERTRNH